jgi:inosine-uridine nucleoside N-ribohydrolase
VDDAVALSMGMKQASKYNYEIKMITTVFGNCSLDNVLKNVAKTRAACGLDAASGPAMVRGESEPLAGERIDAGYFHGNLLRNFI